MAFLENENRDVVIQQDITTDRNIRAYIYRKNGSIKTINLTSIGFPGSGLPRVFTEGNLTADEQRALDILTVNLYEAVQERVGEDPVLLSVDMILNHDGKPLVLEVNPGFFSFTPLDNAHGSAMLQLAHDIFDVLFARAVVAREKAASSVSPATPETASKKVINSVEVKQQADQQLQIPGLAKQQLETEIDSVDSSKTSINFDSDLENKGLRQLALNRPIKQPEGVQVFRNSGLSAFMTGESSMVWGTPQDISRFTTLGITECVGVAIYGRKPDGTIVNGLAHILAIEGYENNFAVQTEEVTRELKRLKSEGVEDLRLAVYYNDSNDISSGRMDGIFKFLQDLNGLSGVFKEFTLEPFANYDLVSRSTRILVSRDGFVISSEGLPKETHLWSELAPNPEQAKLAAPEASAQVEKWRIAADMTSGPLVHGDNLASILNIKGIKITIKKGASGKFTATFGEHGEFGVRLLKSGIVSDDPVLPGLDIAIRATDHGIVTLQNKSKSEVLDYTIQRIDFPSIDTGAPVQAVSVGLSAEQLDDFRNVIRAAAIDTNPRKPSKEELLAALPNNDASVNMKKALENLFSRTTPPSDDEINLLMQELNQHEQVALVLVIQPGQGQGATSKPSEENVVITLDQVRQEHLQLDKYLPENVEPTLVSGGQIQIVSKNVALGVNNLINGVAIVIIPYDNSTHLVANIDSEAVAQNLAASLKGLDLNNSEIYLLEGSNASQV
ncbi:MAG: hypothetical protein NT060_01495, partial [Candidatus Omnitrophica bacterium]|nr:hypothetical protein [Candidatus Omnitrophota bacterium]